VVSVTELPHQFQELAPSFRVEAKMYVPAQKYSKGEIGFSVLPWRWIVERTFAWLGNYRRLARDYNPRTSEAWIKIAMIHLMVRRLA
jgi:transposase